MRTALDGPESDGDGLEPEPAYYVLPGAAEKAARLLERAERAGLI